MSFVRKRLSLDVDRLPNAALVVTLAAAPICAVVAAWWMGHPRIALIMGMLMFTALRIWMQMAARRHSAFVGADGIEWWLLTHRRQSTFVPFASVTAARREDGGIALDLERGKWMFLAVDAEDDLRDVYARVERALVARAAPHDAAGALLTQGAEAASAALGDGGAYRTLPIAAERARDVLENPAADPKARLAACTVLRGRVAAVDRPALLRVADETANPRIRVAIAELVDELDPEPERIGAANAAHTRAR